MSFAPVAGTAARAAQERVDAARALLANPVLTAAAHPDELALVRLHAQALRSTFKKQLGYVLVIEAQFARLFKAPLTADTPARPARRGDGGPFTPIAYTHLALLCAALLAPGTGEMILISALIDQVRADAATIGVPIGDTLPERRALVTAVDLLVRWGVLVEADGTAAAWGERQIDEALLHINRHQLPHLLARPLSGMTTADDLLACDPATADQPRRSLRRRLVENPLVRREDLTEAERDVLSRERSELTRVLADSFGLTLEVRAEGALAYDATGSLTDSPFPGTGTVRQAALLLVDALIARREPQPGDTAVLRDGRAVAGLAAGWSEVDSVLTRLAQEHAKAWSSAALEDLRKLRDLVATTLAEVGLVSVLPGGLVIHPAAARYRPLPASEVPTRAARRLGYRAASFQPEPEL
ncbi:TIGR02678 family protein [Pseudofrankia inefficax]|uniref:TIGR02678 family protein n=1 Tax=Pseudofrankia inefficax (strain DSM 45817 / CECT 9037 / DDB 130130 / EuI1c) TaxID=298654 RepID=E3J1D0_PSEI1|nr:TIGR02678 family protein [Pseudofrankia inefficax]ADP80451.1 Conserved hypothetical protein CHP02678 [Pseudofrankia inefficax]